MKKIKFYLLFLSVFCFCACESDVNHEMQLDESQISQKMTISDESINEVLSFVKNVYPEKYEYLCLTKNDLELEFVTNLTYEATKFLAPAMDDSTIDTSIDTLLSIVNFGNEEGFAIVSVRDNRVLAVTEKGNLSINDLIKDYAEEEFENNPKAMISACVSNYVAGPNLPFDSIDFGTEHIVKGLWEIESQIEPLVQLKIDQDYPYNMYCTDSAGEYVLAGCGAIAVIQMMSANKYPNTIGGVTRNWDNIINQYQTSALVRRTLAQWIRVIGDECGINYYDGQSSCSVGDMMNCISSYPRYTNLTVEIEPSYEAIYSMLSNGKSLPFIGTRLIENGDTAGHVWVVDGCIGYRQLVRVYNSNEVLLREYYLYRNLVHCNWGWEGVCDGYYESNVFDLTDGAIIPDEEDPSTMHRHYNIQVAALIYNLE